LTKQVIAIEKALEKRINLQQPYDLLLSLPGVGRVLGLTIMLETGPINRFADVGNYVSYCRKVPAGRFSNDKKKGTTNRKNGNKYLSWAFAEAGELARRFDHEARAYYNRKRKKTNAPIAHSALSNKLARAAYYIMRDGVPFMPEKAFG
jgi:transposase